MYPKWSPSKCTKRIIQIAPFVAWVATLILTTPESASFAKTTQELPKLLEEVETLYKKSATLSAEFSQNNDDILLAQKKKSSGKIFVKRPSKVRWETQKPDVSLFMSDGQHSWFYTPPFDEGERGQLIERKASEVQSRLTTSLLSGSFSMARDMKIQQKSPSQFVLIPKPGSAGTVIQAILEVDPNQKWIHKITLDHRGGNHTEIQLSHIQLGVPLEDAFFRFHTPPNTDRVDSDEK